MSDVEVLPPVTDIILAVEATPQIVLLDAKKFDAFYEKMKAETDKLVPDVSTKKGRDEIRSMASRVTTTKTSIEKARLQLTKQWRDQTTSVNAAGKEIEQSLADLAAEVRAPLTAWEDEQKEIERQCRDTMDFLRNAAIVTLGDSVESVRERGSKVFETVLDEDVFGALFDDAQTLKGIAMTALKEALTRLEKEEADRAELARLQALEAQRKADEEAARLAAEQAELAKEKARREAEQEEQRKRDLAEAAERAAEEAREKAKREAEAEAQRKIDEANAEAARAKREADEQIARIRKQEEERAAEAARIKAEEEKRAADQEHRAKVKTDAKLAIMSCGADEDTARKIIVAIIAREIPHVSLAF